MGRILSLAILFLVLLSARWVAGTVIDYHWWQEMGQVETWLQMISYSFLPALAAAFLAFPILWIAHARAMKHAGTGLREYPAYARLSSAVLFLLSLFIASISADSSTVIRWAGSRGLAASSWSDPVFSLPLSFYFFDLPFYRLLLGFVLTVTFFTAVIYWLAARGWSLRQNFSNWRETGLEVDIRMFSLQGAFESAFLRAVAAIFLLALAVSFFLARFDLLFDDHGSLVGIDWVAENVTLPLITLKILCALAAAAAFLAGRLRYALVLPAAMLLAAFLPGIVSALYVRPSEITIQKPYIVRHIQATRTAFGLSTRITETDFKAKLEIPIDRAAHKPLLDNVRLWDWRAFHDTVTQIQALRPYYVFNDSDVDRYQIDGQLRQLLITPREIDVAQLPGDARSRWINPHFIYTHGYGAVVAEAARITPDGLPHLLIQNAPPEIKTPALKLSRPEIYFGEVSHEPVFVHTQQPEFNYPSGSGNVETRYSGRGGFPISSPLLRLAAAISSGDWNILLTSYLAPESRMMLHRKVRERLSTLAPFITWDTDPYLVITSAGRLVWMIDGFTYSNAHPYSRSYRVADAGNVNYLRNSVKASVDAYDGTVRLYVFDSQDPILASYRHLFPRLFTPKEEMPADLRAHARYPELIFRLQAEVYRTYHMTNPEAFFNKEDQWDVARNLNGPGGRPEPASPTYIVATLPGSSTPEFLLMTTFTPRNKDNLIGIMVARCDGETLGELHFLQLSKQELIFGPMQIEARINQDQNISKDLSLWNQQGSQVLRGQMLVLPIDDSLLYIEPIYLQASEARMPQLKKVVLAMGDNMVYADTYEQALAELTGQAGPAQRKPSSQATSTTTQAAPISDESQRLLQEVANRLRRYRELMGQGKFSEAGKEIEAIERLAR